MKTLSAFMLSVALGACIVSSSPFAAENVVAIDQGWTEQQKQAWYDAAFGSRLVPLSWALALEQAGSTEPFISPANARRWGLPMRNWQGGSLQLPRGLAVDIQNDTWLSETRLRWKAWQSSNEPWVGLNCAGCHTVDITYQGKELTVDGGATLADAMQIVDEALAAITGTLEDDAKFDRFAHTVLGPDTALGTGYNAANKNRLREAMNQRVGTLEKWLTISHTDLRPGPGRMDATDLVLNKVAINSKATNLTVNPADAPTSVPALWRTMQLDKLQSNGFAPNLKVLDINGQVFDLGYLAGDIGVVQGAFGDVVSHPLALLEGYTSSIRVDNLVRAEGLIHKLKPPAWPTAAFNGINLELAADGKQVYSNNCAGCHAAIDRNDLDTPIKVKQVRLKAFGGDAPIGTDPWMACNTYTFSSPSGNYFGLPILPLGTPSKFGIVGTQGKIADMQVGAVIQTLLGKKLELAGGVAEILVGILLGNTPLPTSDATSTPYVGGTAVASKSSAAVSPLLASADLTDKAQRKAYCLSADNDFLGYIARPLNGIWATAPYLHNGSVPTLYDLLLPAEQRPAKFYTGSHEFDPVKVGYVTAPGGDNQFLFDTSLEGNSNKGHDFGASLTEPQRLALVEYLKAL